MTELEKMKRAYNYLMDLANGIDPISECELPSDTCLNNVRLSRCFFYSADILRQAIENGGSVKKKARSGEFTLTDECRAKLSALENSVQISDFIRPMNELAVEQGMKRVPTTAFTGWLVEEGYMMEITLADNKRRKEPTAKGKALGIFCETRSGQYGMYTAVLYNTNAQQFMLDNLDNIIECWRDKRQ